MKSQLFVWTGKALYVGEKMINSSHTHYACSIIYCPDGLEIQSQGVNYKQKALFLPSNQEHELICHSPFFVIQIDPDMIESLSSELSVRDAITPVPENIFREKTSAWEWNHCLEASTYVNQILDSLGIKQTSRKKEMDYRVRKIVEDLRKLEEIPTRLSLSEWASELNISAERLRHLFVKEVGINFRRYLLWLRIRKLGTMLTKGFSLTDSSHQAGFSDSAHFSKTFKENFGISPTSILTNPNVAFHYCEGLTNNCLRK